MGFAHLTNIHIIYKDTKKNVYTGMKHLHNLTVLETFNKFFTLINLLFKWGIHCFPFKSAA